jgi:hypothetical protein
MLERGGKHQVKMTKPDLRKVLQEGIALVLAGLAQEPPTVTLAPLQTEPVVTTASAELVYA